MWACDCGFQNLSGAYVCQRCRVPRAGGGSRKRTAEDAGLGPGPNRPVPQSGYHLVFTMGRCRLDPHGGDGAYASWMKSYFQTHLHSEGCRSVRLWEFTGGYGNINDQQLDTLMNQWVATQCGRENHSTLASGSTIVLNWHVRFTGTPNGWTGRGISASVVQQIQAACEAQRSRLVVVYTVHEYTPGLREKLVDPSGLVALNPEIFARLRADFPTVPVFESRVPGLMDLGQSSGTERVMEFVEEQDPARRNAASASVLQAFRDTIKARNGVFAAQNPYAQHKGVVIFGMITPRHGLSQPNVMALCSALDSQHVDPRFKVLIAGKTANQPLLRELRALEQQCHRVVVAGEIASLDGFVGADYGISFDPAGYRDNASAQVNLVRAGHLLFSRLSGESDHSLILRAARTIALCERKGAAVGLEAQQGKFQAGSPLAVGTGLDGFFRQL